jgi:site-specific DNA recombinase
MVPYFFPTVDYPSDGAREEDIFSQRRKKMMQDSYILVQPKAWIIANLFSLECNSGRQHDISCSGWSDRVVAGSHFNDRFDRRDSSENRGRRFSQVIEKSGVKLKRKGLWVGGPVPLGYATAGKKLVVVQAEAKSVRTIFTLYLEVGSIAALAEILERKGIQTKVRPLSNGENRGGIPFGVGALAHLLKNRFYIGEVDFRGEIHAGEHEAILDRALFDKVQAKLTKNAVNRAVRLKGSPALLMGRIFDDLGNRMTPSHSNKRGVRYRYYVSHALIQGRKRQAGSVRRIPAVEIEDLVLRAVRLNLSSRDPENVPSDQQAIVAQIDKITAKRDAIEIQLLEGGATSANSGSASSAGTSMISIPWTASTFVAVKGIVQAPQTDGPALNPDKRDVLLNAIAKSRRWIDDITSGRVKSFADIATKEKNVERHIRLLAPLAFVAPSLVQSIIDGIAPANVTVTELAKSSVHSWRNQHHLLKVSAKR